MRTQEYRYNILVLISRFAEWFGVRRPVRFERPVAAGSYDEATHAERTTGLFDQYLANRPKRTPKAGGHPKETAGPDDKEE